MSSYTHQKGHWGQTDLGAVPLLLFLKPPLPAYMTTCNAYQLTVLTISSLM